MDIRLLGKVAVVTGGAGGIGSAIVRRLAAEGASVIAADLLDDAGAELQNTTRGVAYLHHDVTDEHSWKVTMAEAERIFGSVDVLVNAAAIIHWNSLIADTNIDAYRRVIEVNQVGVFLGMKTAFPSLKRAGGGSIINFSSSAGLTGAIGLISYVASKWAVRGMTKTAALEFGEFGIRVNSVHPGRFATPMTQGLPEPVDQPISGPGDVEGLAALVAFLASDEAGYSTGSEFVMDGGQLAGRTRRLDPSE